MALPEVQPSGPAFDPEGPMTKLLHCCDVVPGCDFVAHGVNENEIIIRTTHHARLAHNVIWMTPDLLQRILEAIRDDAPVNVEG